MDFLSISIHTVHQWDFLFIILWILAYKIFSTIICLLYLEVIILRTYSLMICTNGQWNGKENDILLILRDNPLWNMIWKYLLVKRRLSLYLRDYIQRFMKRLSAWYNIDDSQEKTDKVVHRDERWEERGEGEDNPEITKIKLS